MQFTLTDVQLFHRIPYIHLYALLILTSGVSSRVGLDMRWVSAMKGRRVTRQLYIPCTVYRLEAYPISHLSAAYTYNYKEHLKIYIRIS